jgi:AraC-like DNA-binding protein
MKKTMIIDQHFDDLNPISFGRLKCAPGHQYGPVIRDHVVIHYVENGQGVLYKNDAAYPVHKGQAFIIVKGERASYVADKNDPWEYRYIAFTGKLSSRYNSLPPVINVKDIIFPNVEEYRDGVTEYVLAGQLFRLTAELFAEEKHSNQYVRKVKNLIKNTYMEELRIEQIAKEVSLDRRYLSRIFKKETGKTIQEYLLSTRMKYACIFLKDGRSVSECAALCGYSDLPNFSKMFKRTYGISPTEFQKDSLVKSSESQ